MNICVILVHSTQDKCNKEGFTMEGYNKNVINELLDNLHRMKNLTEKST